LGQRGASGEGEAGQCYGTGEGIQRGHTVTPKQKDTKESSNDNHSHL
jgi:ribosomal protein L28